MENVYLLSPVNASGRRRIVAIAVAIFVLATLLYLRLFNPLDGKAFYPFCPFYALTGPHCPGCGTLRGLHQLLHGHVAAAFGYNPLMVVMLPLIGYAFLSFALVGVRGRGLPRVFVPSLLINLLFWVVMAFWVLRNVPVYPFSLLAP